MVTKKTNEKSYNETEIVNYYSKFISAGLFRYEEILIDNYFFAGGKTLDIGCGAGRVTIPLKKRGFKVVGIDYAEKMIEAASALDEEIDYRVVDILSTQFADQEFDNAIFSFNGIMLIETYNERLLAMKEIRRVLKQNGILIFTTPFLDNKVEKSYWKEKAEILGLNTNHMTWEQQLQLGNEYLEDLGSEFFIHVPFISEVNQMISEAGMELLFSARRLDYCGVEKKEDELDDNYLWVIACKK